MCMKTSSFGGLTMNKYENHADEWRAEEAQKKQNRQPSFDPTEGNPEGYCPTCEDHTTQIDRFGCCRECGTEVQDAK